MILIRKKSWLRTVLLLVMLLCTMPALATNLKIVPQKNSNFILEQIAQGLGVPWGMAFLNADELIFTERSGQIKLLNLNSLKVETLTGPAIVSSKGQGGMLDVVIGPNYAQTGWIYFTYTKSTADGAATTLARAKRTNNELTNWQDLIMSQSATGKGQHFGSRITFDDNNHVYFGIGDRGEREQAQNLGNHIGAILRLNLDGTVPDDNPFLADNGALDEIWSYGHRNPQGLYWDKVSDTIIENEHGPMGGDEINIICASIKIVFS